VLSLWGLNISSHVLIITLVKLSGKFLYYFKQLYYHNKLEFHGSQTYLSDNKDFEKHLSSLYSKEWVVDLSEELNDDESFDDLLNYISWGGPDPMLSTYLKSF
jgi:hypothetical protein